MAKGKKQEYEVGALIKVWQNTTVFAESLAEAVEKAGQLSVDDFITVDSGKCVDMHMKIIQVYDNSVSTEIE